ncbi:MAG: PilZ domain-containing protein [Deltaproteobacteria bacterium]
MAPYNNGKKRQTGLDPESKREHVRDNIPIFYEVLRNGDEPKQISDWELMFDDIEPGPEENPRLYELLFDINHKLNILVDYLAEKNGFNLPEARNVNISGGGLRFRCNEFFKPGEMLELKTFLPVFPHALHIRCEVVGISPLNDGGYEVRVKYIDMDESTREKIIKYIFAKQRKILRTTKHDAEAEAFEIEKIENEDDF